MSEQTITHMLIMDRSLSDIDEVTKRLREAGHVLDTYDADEETGIRDAIDNRPLDLILVRLKEQPPSIAEIRNWLEASFKDLPIIAISEDGSLESPAQILDMGAAAMIRLSDPDYAARVIHRELDNLKLRRKVRRYEGLLRESEQRVRLLLDNARDAIAYVHEGAFIYANPAWLHLFLYEGMHDLEGVTLMNMVPRAQRDDLKRFLKRCNKSAQHVEPAELTGLKSDGQTLPLQLSCAPATYKGEPCLQMVAREVSNQAMTQELEQSLDRLTKCDDLTDLYNRRYFTELLEQAHTQAIQGRGGGALLYILLTDYRATIEKLGVLAGDQLVSETARVLRQLIEQQDIPGRFSDSSFTVLTSRNNRQEVTGLAEKIRTTIKAKDFQIGGQLVTTSCCIGICMMGEAQESAQQIIAHADRACETGRLMGGDQIQFYNPATTRPDLTEEQRRQLQQLNNAMECERLSLWYQPIASFVGDGKRRYKALPYMVDDQGQRLALRALAPLAEQHGEMQRVDRYVISRAMELLAAHPGDKALSLFLRFSENSLLEDDFADWLEATVQAQRLPPRSLVLETPETCAQKHFRQTKTLRQRLQNMGINLALSHFGAKDSSESLLRHLVPDYIKLDSPLIGKSMQDTDLAGKLRALAEQARSIEAGVIVDCVSNANQFASVWQFGVSLVQGDMVQEPSPEMNFDFEQFVG